MMDINEILKKAFIHLFQCNDMYFIYDVNTDKILRIPPSIYQGIKRKKITDKIESYVEILVENGYLKHDKVQKSVHPMTALLPYYLDNKIFNLTLQITQNCNLRCKYCAYSGGYNHRMHSNKVMSYETAKKAINYMMDHSSDSPLLYIGFYGGEPLLSMRLIKQCIEYSLKQSEGKKIGFHLTTNGTLFSKENIEFFIKHNVLLLVSLDGPEVVHDKNRVFSTNGLGSYKKIIENLLWIKENYPDYYKSHISFNAVLDPANSFNSIADFFNMENFFEENSFSASLVSDRYAKNKILSQESFWEEYQYSLFRLYLQKFDKLSAKSDTLLADQFNYIQQKRSGKKNRNRNCVPKEWHHGGPCLPGVMRLFVSADGKFFPCERVSELSDIANIGDVDQGIDLSKADAILNIERITSNRCKNCWAYEYCTICIGEADGMTNISEEIIINKCNSIRQNTEELMKDYCVLSILGYDFEKGDRLFELVNMEE